MAEYSISEIMALEPEIKRLIAAFLLERPDLQLKEFSQQTGVSYQVLARYLYHDKGIRYISLIKLYNFMHKMRLI